MENEILQQILTELKGVHNRLDSMDGRLDRLETDVAELKTDVAVLKDHAEVTRESVNTLLDWAEDVELVTQVKLLPGPKKTGA